MSIRYQMLDLFLGQKFLIKMFSLKVHCHCFYFKSIFPSSLFLTSSLAHPILLLYFGLWEKPACSFNQACFQWLLHIPLCAFFCPSEADALNKMTTVICLCHSGPSFDYIGAQKYSARGGRRMCVGWL